MFRTYDEHMQIATYYIISQMRKSPPKEFSQLSDGLIKIASGGGAKGTGGTDLVSFLKTSGVRGAPQITGRSQQHGGVLSASTYSHNLLIVWMADLLLDHLVWYHYPLAANHLLGMRILWEEMTNLLRHL